MADHPRASWSDTDAAQSAVSPATVSTHAKVCCSPFTEPSFPEASSPGKRAEGGDPPQPGGASLAAPGNRGAGRERRANRCLRSPVAR